MARSYGDGKIVKIMFLIKHATLISDQKSVADQTVLIDQNGQIATIESAAERSSLALNDVTVEVIDARGLYLAPGLIDLQLNGGFGHDFTQHPATIWPVAQQLPRLGITGFLPTIITSPLSTAACAQSVLAAGPQSTDPSKPKPAYAQPFGLHLEGPFLNPEKKGAHNQAHLRHSCSRPGRNAWTAENGVRLVTLAPELPGALPVIDQLVRTGGCGQRRPHDGDI